MPTHTHNTVFMHTNNAYRDNMLSHNTMLKANMGYPINRDLYAHMKTLQCKKDFVHFTRYTGTLFQMSEETVLMQTITKQKR